MARFNMEQADNYGNGGGGNYFSLKDDKDTARVRFLYRTMDDVEGFAVHEVEVDGKKRYVNCIREYNEPFDKCPLCAEHYNQIPKLFIKLYNEDAGECQIWERGKAYFAKLASLCARYNPLCDEVVEIERNGKKGDKKTEYVFYPIENSQVEIEDYECPEPLGTMILNKTAEDMNYYLDNGEFPSTSAEVATNRNKQRQAPENNRPTGRRTPGRRTSNSNDDTSF